MKIAAAQISCSLGNPDANLLKVRDFTARAKEAGANLIVFPEMVDYRLLNVGNQISRGSLDARVRSRTSEGCRETLDCDRQWRVRAR